MPLVGLLAAIATLFLRYISVEVLKYVAMRALILSLVVVILPIVLENFMTEMFEGALGLASAQLGDTSFSEFITLTGVFGWVGGLLKLSEAMAVVLSAISVRFALSLIPFLRV